MVDARLEVYLEDRLVGRIDPLAGLESLFQDLAGQQIPVLGFNQGASATSRRRLAGHIENQAGSGVKQNDLAAFQIAGCHMFSFWLPFTGLAISLLVTTKRRIQNSVTSIQQIFKLSEAIESTA